MTSLRKLERDYIEANISEVTALLDRVGDRDVMSRFGLEDQLNELKEALATLQAMPPETLASAALFFGGRPVLGSQELKAASPARPSVSSRTWCPWCTPTIRSAWPSAGRCRAGRPRRFTSRTSSEVRSAFSSKKCSRSFRSVDPR